MELSFYDHINNAEKYLCDRCNIVELREDEWSNNQNERGIYCDECWNWIHLKTWKCKKCNSSGTIRSERIVIKKCQCGNMIQLYNRI